MELGVGNSQFGALLEYKIFRISVQKDVFKSFVSQREMNLESSKSFQTQESSQYSK